jgi:hypothetical protein
VAVPLAEIATEVFVDPKYAPAAKEAIKVTKRFLEATTRAALSPIAAAGGFIADTACDLTKNEYVCDMNSCINVGFEVGGLAVKGAAVGGGVGAAVGAGLGLVKAAFSGDLQDCANGLIKIGGKMVKLAEKYLPNTVAAIKEGATIIKDAVYKKIESVKSTAVAVYNGAKAVYNGVKSYLAPVANAVYDVAQDVYQFGAAVVDYGSQAYNYAKDTAQSVVNTVSAGARKAANYIGESARTIKNAVTSTTCDYLGFWCRRRRRWRRANSVDYNTTDSGIDPMIELLADAEMLATSSKTVFDNADGLFFNLSKGVPIDIGPLVHPVIQAKYGQEPQEGDQAKLLFVQSLASYQSFAQKGVELDSRVETSKMTQSMVKNLFNDEGDLLEQVDLALQLLKMQREETVFDVLEQVSDMNKAFEYTSLQPKLEVNLPDSPSLGDLQQLFGTFSESYSAASAVPTEWKENEATVYYTFNSTTSPDAFNELNQTGTAYFTIPSSHQSKYRDIRLVEGNEINVYMFPLDKSKLTKSNAVTIEITKGRVSTFLAAESTAVPVTFLHSVSTTAKTLFQYDPTTCMPSVSPCTTINTCNSSHGMVGTSPSGEWKISLPADMREAFGTALNLRIAFKVRWFELIVADTNANPAMFANDPCDDQQTCFVTTQRVVPQAECSTGITNDANGASDETDQWGGGKIALVVGLLVVVAAVLMIGMILHQKSTKTKKVLGAGGRTRHTVVNEVYDKSSSTTPATAQAPVEGRCPQCHAKTQFCTCNVRRSTTSQPARHRALTGMSPSVGTNQGKRAYTMDGQNKPAPFGGNNDLIQSVTEEVGSLPVKGAAGICTYISETSGRACTRKRSPGALYCANYHLCPTLKCGQVKAKAQLKCNTCNGSPTKHGYVNVQDAAAQVKAAIAEQHQPQDVPAVKHGYVNVRDAAAQVKAVAADIGSTAFVVQRSDSDQHAFLVPLESEAGGPAYDQASGNSVYYSEATSSAAQPNYDQATSSAAQPIYDQSTASSVYYSEATSSAAQPNYDQATASSVYYSEATATNSNAHDAEA